MLTQLKNLGLSDNEAKVYLAMLELGPATMLQIASKAAINRPTSYVQIESLKKRGLVSTQVRGKRTIFIAESPSQFEAMLERQQKDIELKKEELGKIMPELATMFNLGDTKPEVRFFEGVEGLKRMQEEFLRCKEKQIYSISNLDHVFAIFPRQASDYSSRRIRKGIIAKSLYTTKEGKILPEKDDFMLRESRYFDYNKLAFDADITIFDDSIAIASLHGAISGTIIVHADIANSFKNLFNLIWVVADKI